MNPLEVLKFVGIPVAIATGVLLLSYLIFNKKRVQPLGYCIAVLGASFAAFFFQEGMPAIPPTQKWHYLVLTVLLIAFLSCIYPLLKQCDELIVLQALIAGVIAACIMYFPKQDGFFERIIIGVSVLFVSVGLRRLTIPAWHMFLASWFILAGLSLLALNASFAKLAFFAGAMSAVAAALCVLQWIKPREVKSVQIVFGTLIVGCAACGFAYDQSELVNKGVWILPVICVPISAVAFLICKRQGYAGLSHLPSLMGL